MAESGTSGGKGPRAPPRPGGGGPLPLLGTDRRHHFAIRARTSSAGSTRGAFGPINPNKLMNGGGVGGGGGSEDGVKHSSWRMGRRKNRSSKNRSKKAEIPKSNNMNLADAASMAMSDIASDPAVAADLGNAVSPVLRNKNPPYGMNGAASNGSAIAGRSTAPPNNFNALSHTPLPPHPFSVNRDDDDAPDTPTSHGGGIRRDAPLPPPPPNPFSPSPYHSQQLTSIPADGESEDEWARNASGSGPYAHVPFPHPAHMPPNVTANALWYSSSDNVRSHNTQDIEHGDLQMHQQPHTSIPQPYSDDGRQQEIATFAAIAQGAVDYGSLPPNNYYQIEHPAPTAPPQSVMPHDLPTYEIDMLQHNHIIPPPSSDKPTLEPHHNSFNNKTIADASLEPSQKDLPPPPDRPITNDDDVPTFCAVPLTDSGINYFIKLITTLLYDPHNPEFTSTQQFCWACILGVAMGVLTAIWGLLIEVCVDFVWNHIPEMLLERGVFTDLDGHLPLPYYMIICPSFFGGLLSYITVILPTPIPGQNEWIESLHRIGIMDHSTLVILILISTAGMASGLSLGPELPLVLSAGMIGSYLGKKTHQSILSARAMNLTCAAAAIGGFFGFPMAGALFVLEIPHQMGLQYFEALSPATIASIVAVLVNRICTGNDVHGMFNYPFLSESLPSHIFYIAIIYGLFGSAVGIAYADGCKKLKMMVHDLFHVHDDHHDDHNHHDPATEQHASSETIPLVGIPVKQLPKESDTLVDKIQSAIKSITSFGIKHEPTRAAVVGVLAGAATGTIAMFLPHNLFWGEAQLQTLIDKGRTPLPVFGEGTEPTASMTAYGYCMIDESDEDAVEAGFSTGCMAMIAATKILHIGLSLGTGIVGGHFWGPLFVGAAASHVFIDLMVMFAEKFRFGVSVSTYPCVALLCIMGSTHVVTFRAHMAIMLILTLTISSFSPKDDAGGNYVGGDYSAIFPLLVVSCFISLMITRPHVFYKQQRSRGDIIASPEVLCEPMKEGTPEYPVHDEVYDEDNHGVDDGFDDDDGDILGDGSWVEDETRESSYDERTTDIDHANEEDSITPAINARAVPSSISQADIERDFMQTQMATKATTTTSATVALDGNETSNPDEKSDKFERRYSAPKSDVDIVTSSSSNDLPSKTLDEFLAAPIDKHHGRTTRRNKHRRIKSGSDVTSTTAVSPTSSSLSRVRTSSVDRRHSRNASTVSTEKNAQSSTPRERSESSGRPSTPTPSVLQRVNSYGEIVDFQPSLMNQARKRASSVTRANANNSIPKVPSGRHSRKNSESSTFARLSASEAAGALSAEDLERSFSSVVNQANLR